MPEQKVVCREVWLFNSADWQRLNDVLHQIDWTFIRNTSPHDGVKRLTNVVLESAKLCIRKKRIKETKSTHPWLNDRVLRAVETKRQATGTQEERQKAAECSSIILEEYMAWGDNMKNELRGMPPVAKAWWATERQLQLQKQNL